MIFNIQRYSTHDGDGIRTLVFLKGCPLSCVWCSNPESQRYDKEIFFDPSKCIGCHNCINISNEGAFTLEAGVVQYHPDKCKVPELYEDICPTRAIEVVGESMDVQKLLEILEKDRVFYKKSGGGITFSGGEPLAQSKMLLEVLEQLKSKEIHTAVETCLDIPWKMIEKILPYIDLFLVDLKHLDEKKLFDYTKGNAENIQNNLRLLIEHKKEVVIRIPVIPSFNDTESEILGMLDYVASLKKIKEVHFLGYHTYGIKKYELLGLDYGLDVKPLDTDHLKVYAELAKERGFKAVIGG